jgi:hypothetical protein
MGPKNVFPGMNFIKKSWNAAKQARIFQAAAEPKKRGRLIEPIVEKRPWFAMMCPKAEKDPPKAVFIYQKTKTAGGQRANKRTGTSIRWIETGILRDDSAIFNSPAKEQEYKIQILFFH